MAFFTKLVSDSRKGERNFERARAAEGRGDVNKAKTSFAEAMDAFDAHLADREASNREVRTNHLVMAGICMTRMGRFEEALATLDRVIERTAVPDAFLYAGYSACELGQRERAVAYWSAYPPNADQRILATALKEQIKALREDTSRDLRPVCDAVTEAIYRQDKRNAQITDLRAQRIFRSKRGY